MCGMLLINVNAKVFVHFLTPLINGHDNLDNTILSLTLSLTHLITSHHITNGRSKRFVEVVNLDLDCAVVVFTMCMGLQFVSQMRNFHLISSTTAQRWLVRMWLNGYHCCIHNRYKAYTAVCANNIRSKFISHWSKLKTESDTYRRKL